MLSDNKDTKKNSENNFRKKNRSTYRTINTYFMFLFYVLFDVINVKLLTLTILMDMSILSHCTQLWQVEVHKPNRTYNGR